jgi:hypothetical protein
MVIKMNRKSYKKIANKVVWLGLFYISPIIRFWEKSKLKKYTLQGLRHKPIFIIGAPRTGSTILYQSLSNQADILYVDNLVCKLCRNLFFGFWLSNKIFRQKSHDCFKSIHGNTSLYGLHAPSECGGFWYRWLPNNHHFIDRNEINGKAIQEIKNEIIAVSTYFAKPILFKNLNSGQRLRLIAKTFPNAKFIFIRRDPFFTAQSILQAKRKLGLLDNQFWSIMPRNVEELKELDWAEQIVKQIFYLERQIVEDLKLFPKENVIEVNYLDLDQQKIDRLISDLDLNIRGSFEKANIHLSEKISLKDGEVVSIQNEINKLDWSETHVE